MSHFLEGEFNLNQLILRIKIHLKEHISSIIVNVLMFRKNYMSW